MQTLVMTGEEAILWEDIFARLANIPLIDPYEAYQLLDDDWKQIEIDLEVIQTEGFAAAKQVDPNMVLKKKDGKDQEVQEGWKGHVIPFDLVQKTLLPDDLAALKSREEQLAGIPREYEELLDELSDEEKDGKDFVNVTKDAFVPAIVKKLLKEKKEEPEILSLLKKVDTLINREKTLKKQVKEAAAELHLRTKKTIEILSDEIVLKLLKLKWITPLVESLNSLPQTSVNVLTAKLEALCSKYETTYAEVEQQIADTERTLSGMLDELRGNEFDREGLQEFKKLLEG